MPRKPRWMQVADDAASHVMNRGQNPQTVFADTSKGEPRRRSSLSPPLPLRF
jgi:hypothetical protein